ncbi:hypothetical protein CYLTODRAFT_423129 [Cylindrobasidium torrendii FP15055 ss-10]|uniref:Uncharacterized protein n=1 Tax=Cylindrobasidium torrendii FP15055 ss-10 TaxID=1314674 RepID=A0A0D7B937_9AGAR|nr:hypothetical protein CYLTODRAFT_423129 [Cylindrobasidium torrendii FP15055 ss-10]
MTVSVGVPGFKARRGREVQVKKHSPIETGRLGRSRWGARTARVDRERRKLAFVQEDKRGEPPPESRRPRTQAGGWGWMKGNAELIPGVPGSSPTEKEGVGQRTNYSPN